MLEHVRGVMEWLCLAGAGVCLVGVVVTGLGFSFDPPTGWVWMAIGIVLFNGWASGHPPRG